SGDGKILLWDAVTGRQVRELTGHSRSKLTPCLTFSPDGSALVSGGKDGTVNRWDVATGQPKDPWRWPVPVGEVGPVAYSPDGRLLAFGGQDGTVGLLDAANGQRVDAFRVSGLIANLAFSPDGRTLAAVNAVSPRMLDGQFRLTTPTLRLWDLETKRERSLTGHSGHLLGVSFHPGGKMACTASVNALPFVDGTVRLWDTR